MSPPTLIVRKALLYPWGVVDRHLINIDFLSDAPTLGANNALVVAAVFEPNPALCDRCLKPYLKHRALPDVAFTIFTGCTHGTDPEWETQYPNKAVAAMLPDPSQTPFGCVLVVKHPLSTDAQVSNRDLPILDVDQADIPHLNELVKRPSSPLPLYDIDEILASLTLEEQEDNRRETERHASDAPSAPVKQPSNKAKAKAPPSPPLPAIPPRASSPVPVYDIDEIWASLTLEEQEEGRCPTEPRHTSAPAKQPSGKKKTPPSLPLPATPPRATHREPQPPPYVTPTLYRFSSPTKSGYTPDWSEAAHATQGTGGHAHAVHPKPAKRRGIKAAYVVFRGRSTGVMHTWAEVTDATSGLSFAVHQGYQSLAMAQTAFQHAVDQGWTSSASEWSALPRSIASAPLPVADHTTLAVPELPTRQLSDRWYVVYAGVNPGIFPTNLECALNVLGIKRSVHESVATFAEAQAKFARATVRGEVSVERQRAE
ncbi:hypothetical protein B0H11DRAFT_2237973 [Mycena galericulata]|nr:hypothetical protein B0H11DRAFT_2237973 [Mycena galericulata]